MLMSIVASILILSIIRILVLLFIAMALLWILLTRPAISFLDSNDKYNNADIEIDRLKKHVKALSEEFTPRSYNHPENLNKVADYITSSFRSLCPNVIEQVFEVNGIPYKNIVAEFGPESHEITIIGAHYDTAGEQPGADDNASGVAGSLELGQLLSQEELSGRVVLAAFTLEEPPYFSTNDMGSAIFAKSLAEKAISVKLMICLEMIGYFSEEKKSQDYPAALLKLFYPSTGHFIAIVDQVFSIQAQRMKKWMNRVIEIPVYSINAPSFIPGVDFSDHRNFWIYGYPAVMVTDTAFYRNKAYHTRDDTADRLDYERMAQVVYGIYSYVRHINK